MHAYGKMQGLGGVIKIQGQMMKDTIYPRVHWVLRLEGHGWYDFTVFIQQILRYWGAIPQFVCSSFFFACFFNWF